MADSVAALMLRSARTDAAACKVLDAAADMPDTVLGFHAQQACEKCFKAVLSAKGLEAPRTHDLARLLDLLAAHGIEVPESAQWVDELNPYAVEARYGLVEPGRLDRSLTLATLGLLLQWAESLVQPRPGTPSP